MISKRGPFSGAAMNLIDKVREKLSGFEEQLQRGDRLVVTTTEKCPCIFDDKCKLCGGKGYVTDSITIISPPKKLREDS